MEAMDGMILHDFELRIGWGKAMTLPKVPVWPGPGSGAKLPTLPSGMNRTVHPPAGVCV
jgi:hypothetical protein